GRRDSRPYRPGDRGDCQGGPYREDRRRQDIRPRHRARRADPHGRGRCRGTLNDRKKRETRTMKRPRRIWGIGTMLPMLLAALPALADDAGPPKIDTGDTAWMLASTALVLMMTIPGLALFYAGMVRKKNVLATMMQSFAITCLVTLVWAIAGYSLAFTAGNPYVGDLSRFL